MYRDLGVAFLEIWVEPDLHPVLHLPEQQRLTAYITALRNQCLLGAIFSCHDELNIDLLSERHRRLQRVHLCVRANRQRKNLHDGGR